MFLHFDLMLMQYMNRLPNEMVWTILQKAAWIGMRTSCEAQSNAIPAVYVSLASVCSMWKSILSNGSFKRFLAKALFGL